MQRISNSQTINSSKKSVAVSIAFVMLVFTAEISIRLIAYAISDDTFKQQSLHRIASGLAILLFYQLVSPHFLLNTQISAAPGTGWAKILVAGTMIGFAVVALAMLLLAVGGGLISSYVNGEAVVSALALAFGVSVLEEVLFRGVLLQILGRFTTPLVAALIVAVVFTLGHIDGRSITSVAAIFIGGGLAYSLAFFVSQSLWTPIGIHLGSNFLTILTSGVPDVMPAYIIIVASKLQIDLTALISNGLLLAVVLIFYKTNRTTNSINESIAS